MHAACVLPSSTAPSATPAEIEMIRKILRDPPWLFLAFFGAGSAAIALGYNFGTANNIGAAVYPLILSATIVLLELRSAARRVGRARVSTCRSRGAPNH